MQADIAVLTSAIGQYQDQARADAARRALVWPGPAKTPSRVRFVVGAGLVRVGFRVALGRHGGLDAILPST
jgi:hypothetical protein